jgi:hypothetical protein
MHTKNPEHYSYIILSGLGPLLLLQLRSGDHEHSLIIALLAVITVSGETSYDEINPGTSASWTVEHNLTHYMWKGIP